MKQYWISGEQQETTALIKKISDSGVLVFANRVIALYNHSVQTIKQADGITGPTVNSKKLN